ncbi:winged helix-turn-helix domain-containing protein, partial [Klebsiella pneumoniae]|nr:winged helix-turn-helix domain-containing protein [Klebsiella pneumoniae]
EYAGVILNTKSMDLHYQGEVLSLTKNEFQILRVLFEHAGNIVARDDLMRELWNSDFFIDDNTLSVNVARLRKKLEEEGLIGFIETKKGIGYG